MAWSKRRIIAVSAIGVAGVVGVGLAGILYFSGRGSGEYPVVPTQTPAQTLVLTGTPTPTLEAVVGATSTPEATATQAPYAAATATAVPAPPTATAVPTLYPADTPTPTPLPADTPTPVHTATPTTPPTVTPVPATPAPIPGLEAIMNAQRLDLSYSLAKDMLASNQQGFYSAFGVVQAAQPQVPAWFDGSLANGEAKGASKPVGDEPALRIDGIAGKVRFYLQGGAATFDIPLAAARTFLADYIRSNPGRVNGVKVITPGN